MGTWNHRVMKVIEPDGSEWLAIYEVHYDEAGKPIMHTQDAVEVADETMDGLRETLYRMLACLSHPVLTVADFEKPAGKT